MDSDGLPSQIKLSLKPNPGCPSFLNSQTIFAEASLGQFSVACGQGSQWLYSIKPKGTISLEGDSVNQLTMDTVIRVTADRIMEKYR